MSHPAADHIAQDKSGCTEGPGCQQRATHSHCQKDFVLQTEQPGIQVMSTSARYKCTGLTQNSAIGPVARRVGACRAKYYWQGREWGRHSLLYDAESAWLEFIGSLNCCIVVATRACDGRSRTRQCRSQAVEGKFPCLL